MPYISQVLAHEPFPIVATGDYMKAVPDQIARWAPSGFHPLGTDGFGRSEARAELRNYFEIDARYVSLAALQELSKVGLFDRDKLGDAVKTLGIDPLKLDPMGSPQRDKLDE
jgi:pyruvate dehydrogenase E1 component